MAAEKREKLEAQIKAVDMSEDMQGEAIAVATEAMGKYHIEKVIEAGKIGFNRAFHSTNAMGLRRLQCL